MKNHLYYETLDWKVYCRNLFRQDKRSFLQALRDDFGTEDVFMTRSARTGIILSLKAFGLTREDEVLVPRFMSMCVLDAVHQVARSSPHLTERTKAVLFYHHWGYQQNYAKAEKIIGPRKWWVLEDCAHGVWGKSQGKAMGTFGHTAVFSLPKIFETTYAGALRVNDNSLSARIKEMLPPKTSWWDKWESMQGEWEYVAHHNTSIQGRENPDVQVRLAKWYATLLTYPNLSTIRGQVPRNQEEVHAVFTEQNKHFLFLLGNARHRSFMLSGDEEASMAPLCFPIISEDLEFLKKISLWLKARHIFIPIFHFDINRCMFEPDYRKCVPIPLYASLPEGLYADFVREFKGGF